MDLCVVHLRRPIGNDGLEKQRNQCRALLRWAMRHLSGDPKANLVILGDFNEGHPVGSNGQALSVLFQAKPPMVDALSTLSGKISTHTDGKAYDRILVSEAVARGLNRLKLDSVAIQPHRHGKGEERGFTRTTSQSWQHCGYSEQCLGLPDSLVGQSSRRPDWLNSHFCKILCKTETKVQRFAVINRKVLPACSSDWRNCFWPLLSLLVCSTSTRPSSCSTTLTYWSLNICA